NRAEALRFTSTLRDDRLRLTARAHPAIVRSFAHRPSDGRCFAGHLSPLLGERLSVRLLRGIDNMESLGRARNQRAGAALHLAYPPSGSHGIVLSQGRSVAR